MPRTYKLTWQAGSGDRPGRWLKKHKGKRYYFTGGRGKTDREAHDAAVAAWEALKVRLDNAAPRPHQDDYEKAISRWEEVLTWCNKHKDDQMAAKAVENLARLRKQFAAATPKPLKWRDRFEEHLQIASPDTLDEIAAIVDSPVLKPSDVAATANTQDLRSTDKKPPRKSTAWDVSSPDMFDDPYRDRLKLWEDRLRNQRVEAVPADKSLGSHAAIYLTEKRALAAAGSLSKGRVYAINLHLQRFQDWFGKTRAAAEIDAQTLAAYRIDLLKNITTEKWSHTTANHHLATVRSLTRWLWQVEAIPTLPRNLDGASASLRIGRSMKGVVVFTTEEIKTLIENASDRTKLYVLLMLNCGMTQKDIADLKRPEVDWVAGRITRKRSKTGNFRSVPTVSYRLWPETFRLLKQEQNGDADTVLLNENGGRLWLEQLGDGEKYRKNDNVKNAFHRLCRKTGIQKPLKSLKKTSATLIRGSARFAGLEGLFLGHAPLSMADRHYTQVPQALLDEAVGWLESQYDLGDDANDEPRRTLDPGSEAAPTKASNATKPSRHKQERESDLRRTKARRR
jgi:integrase